MKNYLLVLVLKFLLKVKEVNPEQPWKALLPILFTLSGINNLSKEEQPQNACSPILITVLGISTDSNEEQFMNARSPILVTVYVVSSCITSEGIDKISTYSDVPLGLPYVTTAVLFAWSRI